MGAAQLRFGTLELSPAYLVVLLAGLLLASVIMPASGAFREEFRWEFLRKTRRLIAGWALVVMSLVTLGALFKVTADYSRIWFGLWVLFGLVGLLLSTLAEHLWMLRKRRRQEDIRPVVLVGGGDNAARLERRIDSDPSGELRVEARFGKTWNGHAAQPVSELADYVASSGAREIWIAAPWDDHELLQEALEALRETVVDINVVPDLHQYRLLNQGITEWAGIPVVNLSATPMTGSELAIKAALDRIMAAVLLILLAPLLLLIGLLVRLSSRGPALFHQPRHGIDGEAINVLKFRTMRLHRERPGQVTQATEADARITAVGRILRRSSLDELPQLINVLRGEMSLVGPRPHAIEHNDAFKSRIPRYMMRHKVRPGITGWAQVNGLRGITDTPEKMALRIEHDLWYIQNWSLWLDLRILLMTPLAMVHRNAI